MRSLLPVAYLACLLACPGLLHAQTTFANGTYAGSCSVRFEGKSNLHGFTGTIAKVPLSVSLQDGDTLNMTTKVAVTSLNTAKPARDREMWKMFQSDKFPHLGVQVRNASLKAAYPGPGKTGKLPVTLTIAGHSKTVTGRTQNFVTGTNGGSFDLALTLSLKDLGLNAPRALAGTIRVKDTVTVLCKVELER
tara:strand:- start:3729 stop:4304 length:576 start_codon:yes stop_codon:yes gene_type:complete